MRRHVPGVYVHVSVARSCNSLIQPEGRAIDSSVAQLRVERGLARAVVVMGCRCG